jgi:hypothetical protein
MSKDPPKRESMSIEEATVSNMWGIGAIVEMLEGVPPLRVSMITPRPKPQKQSNHLISQTNRADWGL